jgi:hypothetical protein
VGEKSCAKNFIANGFHLIFDGKIDAFVLMHLLQQQFVIIEANLAHHGGLGNPKKFG